MDTPVADEAKNDVSSGTAVANQYRIDDLRKYALGLAVEIAGLLLKDGAGTETAETVSDAEAFLAFLKGEKAAE